MGRLEPRRGLRDESAPGPAEDGRLEARGGAGEEEDTVIREMARHVSEHADFLFLYQPVGLAAVNKAVDYAVPDVSPAGRDRGH
jgi:hypothetical protein